jgi:hypothetical protein
MPYDAEVVPGVVEDGGVGGLPVTRELWDQL